MTKHDRRENEDTLWYLVGVGAILLGLLMSPADAGMLDAESGYEKPTFTSSVLSSPSRRDSPAMTNRRLDFWAGALNKPRTSAGVKPFRVFRSCSGRCNWDAGSLFDRDGDGRISSREASAARQERQRDERRHGGEH